MELDAFRKDLCRRCGNCLMQCPALRLSEDQAKAEIERLWRGEPGRHIPGKCCSCFLCDFLCPNGANPHSLILNNWNQRIRRQGVPFYISYSAPLEPGPNLWTRLARKYSAAERRTVQTWEENFQLLFHGGGGGEEAEYMLVGCNQWLDPFVTQTPLFEKVRIAGSRSYCCGEPYYRAGMLDRASEIFERNLKLLANCRAERLIMFCPPGFNMLENVYPKLTARNPGPELISLPAWLLQNIENGRIKLRKKLDWEVWVQRNCHEPLLGKEFCANVRGVLEAVGARVVEKDPPGHSCCGLGPAASRQNPLDMALQMVRHLRGLPSGNVVCYCNGCLMTMAGLENARPLGFRFYHLLDLVRLAAGEQFQRGYARRALQTLFAGLSLTPDAMRRHGLRYRL